MFCRTKNRCLNTLSISITIDLDLFLKSCDCVVTRESYNIILKHNVLTYSSQILYIFIYNKYPPLCFTAIPSVISFEMCLKTHHRLLSLLIYISIHKNQQQTPKKTRSKWVRLSCLSLFYHCKYFNNIIYTVSGAYATLIAFFMVFFFKTFFIIIIYFSYKQRFRNALVAYNKM